MERRTKILLVAVILGSYTILPFGAVLDSLLLSNGYQNTVPYLIVNLWEATIFVAGIIVGVGIMRRDIKKAKVKDNKML